MCIEIPMPEGEKLTVAFCWLRYHSMVRRRPSSKLTLGAIGKNRGRFAVKQLGNEFRQHARIGRCWILPRSKNIEVPQADGFQPIATVKRSHVILAGQLGDSVWRNRIWRHVLMLRQSPCVTVRGRGCGVYNSLNF